MSVSAQCLQTQRCLVRMSDLVTARALRTFFEVDGQYSSRVYRAHEYVPWTYVCAPLRTLDQ